MKVRENDKEKEEKTKDDPGSVTLPVIIENINFDKALVDLGSSTNLIPLAIVKNIGTPDLQPTTMKLQLADKSIVQLVGIVKGVMVKLESFLLPTDFVVINMDEDDNIPLILGRPFIKAS